MGSPDEYDNERLARLTQAVDERKLVALQGNVHALARLEYDRGPVPTPNRCAGSPGPAAKSRARGSTASSARRTAGQILGELSHLADAGAVRQQFGPADADIQTLTQWLKAKGFTDIKVGAGQTVIEFSGNVANVRNAFHTQIHRYLVNGEEHLQTPAIRRFRRLSNRPLLGSPACTISAKSRCTGWQACPSRRSPSGGSAGGS